MLNVPRKIDIKTYYTCRYRIRKIAFPIICLNPIFISKDVYCVSGPSYFHQCIRGVLLNVLWQCVKKLKKELTPMLSLYQESIFDLWYISSKVNTLLFQKCIQCKEQKICIKIKYVSNLMLLFQLLGDKLFFFHDCWRKTNDFLITSAEVGWLACLDLNPEKYRQTR